MLSSDAVSLFRQCTWHNPAVIKEELHVMCIVCWMNTCKNNIKKQRHVHGQSHMHSCFKNASVINHMHTMPTGIQSCHGAAKTELCHKKERKTFHPLLISSRANTSAWQAAWHTDVEDLYSVLKQISNPLNTPPHRSKDSEKGRSHSVGHGLKSVNCFMYVGSGTLIYCVII